MSSLAEHTRLTLGALLLGLSSACGNATPPDVLIVTVDTLRADHIGAYGSTVTETPNIDRLADQGALFVHAAAPMPLTRPSHFTLFTSRYPREHGVMNNAMALPESALTLAEIFASKGYRTGAFVAVRLLGPSSGAQQGFETLDAPADTHLRGAEEVVPMALAWLDDAGSEPTFLWVHLFDPHQPYAPPEGFRAGLDPKLAQRHPSIEWEKLLAIARANDGNVPAPIFEHAKALYAREVEYTDHWIGKLTEGLSTRGRLEKTVLVFTSDHGEAFENGYYFEHADSLYEGTMRVPLILRSPGHFEPGTRYSGQVGLVDVAPTVLAAAGFDVPAAFSGRSLVGAPDDGERLVLLQHPFYQPQAAAMRPRKQRELETVAGEPTTEVLVDAERVGLVGAGWKYLRTGDQEELYRLWPDADEGENLAADEAEQLDRLRAALAEQLSSHPLNILDIGEINSELLETLKALGYAE